MRRAPLAPLVLAALAGAHAPGAMTAQATDPVFIDPLTGNDLLNAAIPSAAGRDRATQYMMLDSLDIVLPGRETGGDGESAEPGEAAPDDALYLAVGADGAVSWLSGPSPGGGDPFADGGGVASGRDGPPADPAIGEIRHQEGGILAFLTSLGTSTGEAFELRISNGSADAVRIGASGIVVEPMVLVDQARDVLESQIMALASRNPLTAKVTGYCLEFLKQPPSVDQLFRIAETELQELYAPARNILRAGRHVFEDGLFSPDSDPIEYMHSIKQWALWAFEGDFTVESFSEAFLAHTEDNFVAAGRPWTEQIAELTRGLIPNRWGDIQQVLETAAQLTGGPGTGD